MKRPSILERVTGHRSLISTQSKGQAMKFTRFQKITLGVSSATALAIGLFILIVPKTFYASYGIALEHDPNLLSELRAPGAGLAALGALMLAGLVRVTFAPVAIVAAFTVYLAFPVGRVVSIAVDGMPSQSILAALVIELVIACLLVTAFGRRQSAAAMREAR